MDDVRVLLRDCSPNSLVLLDEIGKGTSARDGAALSGALLEALDAVPVTAVFATHLHELFDLPLATRHLAWKRMGMEEEGDGQGVGVRWTYRLEDGRCTDSMALHTARCVRACLRESDSAAWRGPSFNHRADLFYLSSSTTTNQRLWHPGPHPPARRGAGPRL